MTTISASWTRLVSSVRLQRSSQSLAVLGSRAFIFGGEVQPREPIDNQTDVIELISRSDAESTTTTTTTLPAPAGAPTPRVGAAVAHTGDAFYIFSGRGGVDLKPLEEEGALWRYTPAISLWDLVSPAVPTSPYPVGRSYHAMTSDPDARVLYLHAGCGPGDRLSDLWAFDIAERTWTELPAAPDPPRGGTSIAFVDGRIYRMNGFDGQTEQGGTIDVLDLRESSGGGGDGPSWSTIPFPADGAQGPEARSVAALLPTKHNGRQLLVTLFGERDPSSLGHAGAGKMLGDVWVWDLEESAWSKVEVKGDDTAGGGSSFPAPRGWFDADVNGEGSIIVHGGLAEDNSRLGDVWKLQFA